MHNRIFVWPALMLLALSTSASAASIFEGTYHNDRSRDRATLETGSGIYELDFQGVNIYGVGERFDRDRAVVRGTLSHSRYSHYPVLVVDRITFRPHRGQRVTYRIRDRWDGHRRYNVRDDRFYYRYR